MRTPFVVFSLVLATTALISPASAETNADLVRRVILRGVERYEDLGRKLYPGYLQYAGDHREELRAKLGDGYPLADQVRAMATVMTEAKLGEQMQFAQEEMVTQIGNDDDARLKASEIFKTIKQLVFADLDKQLGR